MGEHVFTISLLGLDKVNSFVAFTCLQRVFSIYFDRPTGWLEIDLEMKYAKYNL